MKCKICKRKITITTARGGIFDLFNSYCQKCYYKKLISEAKEEVVFWQNELYKLK